MKKTRICIVTGSRADYGLLKTLMREIRDDSNMTLQIIATGMHLAPEFGRTLDCILQDGFEVDDQVESLLSGDSTVSVVKSVGLGMIGFADSIQKLQPDLMVLLGDRYEILAAASAAMLMHKSVAHIHGGEATEGAIDESIRHAITKMSHVHFTSTETYRQRVIQMGERPDLVFAVGAPGLDLAAAATKKNRDFLADFLKFSFRPRNILVTYHPETLAEQDALSAAREVTRALTAFPEIGVIITTPNADAAGRVTTEVFRQFAAAHSDRVLLVTNLGELYFSLIQEVDFVLGNSSSGIIEVPFFKKPTVNIGDRQKGRLKARSVIDCRCEAAAIIAAMDQAQSLADAPDANLFNSPYGTAGASKQIKQHIEQLDLAGLKRKPFHDLAGSR